MNLVSRFFSRAGAAALACCAGALLLLPMMAAQAADVRWAASWAAAPQDYQQLPPALRAAPPEALAASGAQTLRERLLPTLGGRRVRIRFSNVFGKMPLHIAAASVARSTGGAAVSPATLRQLQFGGRTDITLAPGAEAWSDAARLSLEPGQAAAVSFEVGAPTSFATAHHLPPDATWMLPGRAVMRTSWRDAAPSPWNHVVTGLDVASATAPRVVVAFGDSITEGVGGRDAQGQPGSYPDQLATRLRGQPGGRTSFAVINAGIAGNRLLADRIGPGGIARFGRDVLGQSGVTHVLILIGINDLLFGQSPGLAEGGKPLPEIPGVEQITAGLQQLIRQARDKGVKVLLGTLLPFKGMPAPYWSGEREARRQAVNRWIRGRQDVEAVVDFDAALRDPADPAALNPLYDSGDHLHPSHAGYAAMAGAVDPQELRE
ncbi:SGNH/GDSL hydrolase family protein [Variovorax sp. PBL-E5]|uniref:SGNH/GDSL hydrolase family protein n=1 Tax=Variovorax sp. PBL-E5 TaxID=434014 RepID=UPI001317924B|nr:SGNH/GDSL hydrolase family protein [Variovorax sp. PBL-E5]VTU17757.1 GDSL-like Lipase/Acylhydrolase [Variovorax sp. PBL-E5]